MRFYFHFAIGLVNAIASLAWWIIAADNVPWAVGMAMMCLLISAYHAYRAQQCDEFC